MTPRRYLSVIDAVRAERARTILEVGTWNGDRALAMAAAALEGSDSAVYIGFDLFEDITTEKSRQELNVKILSYEAMVRSRLEAFKAKNKGFSFFLHKGDTRSTLPRFISSFGAGRVDLVWLDGGHSVETVSSDWSHCYRVTRPGGVILMDDFYSDVDQSFLERFGCNRLVERLGREGHDIKILPDKDPVVGGGLVQIAKIRVSHA